MRAFINSFIFKLIVVVSILVALIVWMRVGYQRPDRPITAQANQIIAPEVSAFYASFDQEGPIIEGYGRIQAKNAAEWVSEVTGRVNPYLFRLNTGESFINGDVLLTIQNDELTYSLYQLKSQFLNDLTNLVSDLTFDFPNRKRIWTAYLNAFDIQMPIPSLPAVDHSKEKYFLNKRNIYSVFYQIKSLEAKTDKYSFKAPYDGEVLESFVEPYGSVKTGQSLARLIPKSGFESIVNIPVQDSYLIKEKDPVIIYTMESNQKWRGYVKRIGSGIREKDYSIPIVIGKLDDETGVIHNQYVKVKIQTAPIKESVKLEKSLVSLSGYVHIAKQLGISPSIDPQSDGSEDTQLQFSKEKLKVQKVFETGDIVWVHGIAPQTVVLSKPYIGIANGATLNVNIVPPL